ncbi:hypothetical protein CC79DRAFT_682932 [Sarocladium strictum]
MRTKRRRTSVLKGLSASMWCVVTRSLGDQVRAGRLFMLRTRWSFQTANGGGQGSVWREGGKPVSGVVGAEGVGGLRAGRNGGRKVAEAGVEGLHVSPLQCTSIRGSGESKTPRALTVDSHKSVDDS